MKDFKINIQDSDGLLIEPYAKTYGRGGKKSDLRLREADNKNIRRIFDYLGSSRIMDKVDWYSSPTYRDLPSTTTLPLLYEDKVQFFEENPFAIMAWYDSYGNSEFPDSLFTNFTVFNRDPRWQWSGISPDADATTLTYDMIRLVKGDNREEWMREYGEDYEEEYREGIEFLRVGDYLALGSDVPFHSGIGIANITSKNWHNISPLIPNHETQYNVRNGFINWATLPNGGK